MSPSAGRAHLPRAHHRARNARHEARGRCRAILRGAQRGGVFREDPGRQTHRGHARSREAHRQPEVGPVQTEEFEDHYKTVLVDLINQKRAGKAITPKEQPRGENAVDLMTSAAPRPSGKGSQML